MNKAYEAMRAFWLDVKNLQHKQDVPQLGEHKICVAGIEMAALDAKGEKKNILIAASSLGNASVYFENNSPSGLGGFTGGSSSGVVYEKAQCLLKQAALSAEQLTPAETLPTQENPQQITLFTVSADGKIRMADMKESEVRTQGHPLYAFFAYTQQLLGAFRTQQEAMAKNKANTPKAEANK